MIFPYFEKKKQIGFERTINSSLPYSFQQGLGQARPNKKLSQRGKNFQELKICGHGTILALTVRIIRLALTVRIIRLASVVIL